MRSLVLAALIFLSFAPSALAYGYQANGSTCVLPSGNECQSGVCSDVLGSRTCSPCTATSCGAGATCGSSGVCVANAVTPPPPPPPPAATTATGGSAGSGTATGGSVGSGTVAQPVTLINPLKGVDCASGTGNCLLAFLNNILTFVIEIGTVIIILMLVFVGYKFVAAQGSDSKITEARTMLLWTVIGALVLLGAKAISLGILSTVQALGG